MARSPSKPIDSANWTDAWLTAVAQGASTMSQRSLSTIDKRGGGLWAVRAAAKAKGVHLLLLEDETGTPLVAARTQPFKVIC